MYDRRKTIGASDAVLIWQGNWSELYDRKQHRDESNAKNPWPLAARIGKATEALNREWFTEQTGIKVVYDEAWEENPMVNTEAGFPEWMKYTPDGLIISDTEFWQLENAILEAKFVTEWWKPSSLIAKYMPQLQHGMRIAAVNKAYFSVFFGNHKWDCFTISYDPVFDEQLANLEHAFYWHLENQVRPEYFKR